jgi:RNA polymerase sigma-70 factor (ECF subfamily)
MDQRDEREILEAVLRGRKELFEHIVRHYQAQSHAVAVALVRDTEDALDLCQDAFLRAYRGLRTFDLTQPFFPWFYRILRNLCLSYLKRRRPMFSLTRSLDDEEVQSDVPDDARGPAALAEMTEEVAWMYRALERLPVKDREILALRHFQELSYAEIAEALDIPIGTVMSRLFYARRKLKERMEQELE